MRASSVLPTPVGPRNRNDPMGRFGSDRPARDRRIAFATALTASSWPMTRPWRTSSMRTSLAISPSMSRLTGMPVHFETISATSSSSTSSLSICSSAWSSSSRTRAALDLLLELAHRAVAQLRRLLEVALALGPLGVGARGLQLLLERADLGDRVLLVLPVRDLRVPLLGELGELGLDRREPPLRRLVGLLGERGLLDLELADPPLDRRRSRTASSRSRCAGATRPRRSGRWPCRGAGAPVM